ncbi:MAG: FAD-dependent monooxygenase [Dissulfuribacterales bacterium]
MEKYYDVLVIGSGPAGAAAAKALDGSELSVALIERKKLPRYKMCSGILFPSTRAFVDEHFGLMPEKILCEPGLIKGNRVFLNNETPVMDTSFSLFDEGRGLPEEGFNVWRSDFDLWLAKESDATLIDDCRFTGFIEKSGQYEVFVEKSGERSIIRAGYIIGADGTISQVRRSAFPDFDKDVKLFPNYEEIYEGDIDLEPGWLYLFLDRSLSGYFATLFHKDDKLAVVTGVHQGESVKEYFNRFREHLGKNHGLRIKNKVESHGIQLTDMSATKNYCLGRENILLAGEAGGFLRGVEGITSALVSGYAAGQAVLESHRTKVPAINYFKKFAAKELATCEKAHENLTAIIGYNVFIRSK